MYIYYISKYICLCSLNQCCRKTRLNPCQVKAKTQKMVLDASLLKTQHYEIWIKDEWSK